MRTTTTYRKQGGFFAIGIALVLTAVFGATTAAIVATGQEQQNTAAAAPQPQAPAAIAVANREAEQE
jgi:hypothetical protein